MAPTVDDDIDPTPFFLPLLQVGRQIGEDGFCLTATVFFGAVTGEEATEEDAITRAVTQ